ncbi:hypothetical protein O6H91_16G078700 [Diphasiastrum complanatum]|uniref:Uncharacterized protein n=1 Tax=Diphasiastrum complanatum TaxID=34168 RepID=A0ACC2BDT6_DIPCM|nr:hypothetical protein O6H91_16G078700 [Diphasiastrum complanatum]
MSFSSRPFLAEKSSGHSPVAPTKSPLINAQGKVHKQQSNSSPKSLSKKWEHKENHGLEKGRFGFSEKPPIAGGKSFLSPKGTRVAASAAKSPLIRPSPRKILGERNPFYREASLRVEENLVKEDKFGISLSVTDAHNITKDVAVVQDTQTFHPEANLPAEEALIKEDTFGIRSFAAHVHTISKDLAVPEKQQTEQAEMSFVGLKPAASLGTRETLPVGSSASLQELVESILREMSHSSRSELVIQESYLQQQHSLGMLGKDSNKGAHLSEQLDSVSAVTEEYNVNKLSSPQHLHNVRAELKHEDNFYPETEREIPVEDCCTESCGSAVNATGATTPLKNDLHESETLEGFENEVSSENLAANDKANVPTGEGECDAVSAGLLEVAMEAHEGCFEVKHDLPQSAARARFFHSKVCTFLCVAAVILLSIGSHALPTLVQQSPFSRFWQDNIYSEQVFKMLIKGAEGLWTDSPTTYHHYPILQGFQLQKNVEIAVTVTKKNLQSAEVLSRVIRSWRFVKEETIGSLDVESFQSGIERIGRFVSFTFNKMTKKFWSRDLQNSLQKMSEHWKHQLPACLTPLHIQATAAKFRHQLAERVQTHGLMMAVERLTTHVMSSTSYIMKTLQYQASLSKLKEEYDKLKNRLFGLFQAKISPTGLVESVSSVVESLQYDTLRSWLHTKYVNLKYFTENTVNAFMETVMRKPAQERRKDRSVPSIEEWDWFSEYDIPYDEYLEPFEASEKAMTTSTDLPQLDGLLSAILYGSSVEIKARYLDLLHIMDSDEEIELPLNALEQGSQPADDGVMTANNECHFETWEEEILSMCVISKKESMGSFNLPLVATSPSTELRQIRNDDMIMHMGTENIADEIESNLERLQDNPVANDRHTSQLAEFEHQQASVIKSANCEEQALPAKNSEVSSLRSSLSLNDGTVFALIIVAFSLSAVYFYGHYKLLKAKKLAKFYDIIEGDDSTNLKEANMHTPQIKEVEKFTGAGTTTATFSTPECTKRNNMEGTLNTSPDHFVESPFGSFTAYKRVIQKEVSS